MKTPNVECLACRQKVYMPKHRLKTFKYCSRICKNNSNTIHIKANCRVCKNEFEHISSRCNKAKYCSRKCYYKSRLIFDGGTSEKKCFKCHKIFHDAPSKTRKFCSKKCANIARMDTIVEPKHQNNFRKFWMRRGVIQKCEKCGYDKVPEILGMHHIDQNRKNNTRENLMVLCPTCHSLIHRKHIPH